MANIPIQPAPLAAALPLVAVPSVAALADMAMAGSAARTPRVKICPRQRAFDERQHLFVQQFASARKPLSHGVLGQFEVVRYGCDGLMLTIKKNNRVTVNFRNLFQRPPENRGFFVADGLFGGQWFG